LTEIARVLCYTTLILRNGYYYFYQPLDCNNVDSLLRGNFVCAIYLAFVYPFAKRLVA
jgi:hypothetical protein